MLRITNTSSADEQRWILYGQLAGRWVRELQVNWESKRDCPQGRRRVIDLTDVLFVDESGELLLRELKSDGAEFVGNCGVEVKHMVDHLPDGGPGTVRKYLARPEECGD